MRLITGVCVRVPTCTCVRDPPAEVFSGVVAVEQDGDDVAVGLNLAWRPVAAERTELPAARLNLTHAHLFDCLYAQKHTHQFMVLTLTWS